MPEVMTRLDETVDRVVDADLGSLPDVELGAEILALTTQIRRLEAARARRVREFEVRDAAVAEGCGSAVSWLRARTSIGKHDADAIRGLGRSCDRLPVMGAALAAGEVTPAHVQVLAGATRRLDPDRVANDEKQLTDLARELDPRAFGVCVER